MHVILSRQSSAIVYVHVLNYAGHIALVTKCKRSRTVAFTARSK